MVAFLGSSKPAILGCLSEGEHLASATLSTTEPHRGCSDCCSSACDIPPYPGSEGGSKRPSGPGGANDGRIPLRSPAWLALLTLPDGLDLVEQPNYLLPSLRIHRQRVDDVGPVIAPLVAVAHQLRGDRVAVGPVVDQDAP